MKVTRSLPRLRREHALLGKVALHTTQRSGLTVWHYLPCLTRIVAVCVLRIRVVPRFATGSAVSPLLCVVRN